MRKAFQRIRDEEAGHITVGLTALVAAIGAVVLGYGAADGSDAITVVGGWILGVGIFVASVARHRTIDYEVFDRLDKLEK